MDQAFLGKDWEIILHHFPVVCCGYLGLPVFPNLTPRADFFLHPLPASSLLLGMQHVTDPPVPKPRGYWWAAGYTRKGGRQKCISTNAGFSLIVYLCVQG